MPNLSSSAASSSSAHQSRHRSHRPSRSQLEKNLQILARAPEPLPASLPSPPPSRGASPPDLPASLKRKLDHSYPQESSSKRSRPSDILPPPPPPPPPRRQAYAQRSDPVEEGELPDDLPSPQLSSSRPSQPPPPASPLTSLSTPFLPAIANIPIARPRKRLRRDDPTFLQLYERYFKYGKILKYSSDCHYLASFPPSHKDYKPLANPPPPTDAYHQRSALMGRLEGVDAMMCFAYSLWAKDYTQNSCNFESWRSLNSFMASTKSRWTMDNTSELDRAFLGLIWMVEGFIQSRVLSYLQKETGPEFDRLQRKSEQILAHAQAPKPPAPSVQAAAQQRTPPMLPSPASIAPASSANSTPTGRDAETPNSSAASPAVRPPAPSSSSAAGPRPPAVDKAAIAVPISAHFSDRLQMMNKTFGDARLSMKYAQMHLTLRTLAAHFPETFQRILQSSLRQEDEPEPDIEDDAGELFWPGAPTTGEGIGWVCLMGKAMINEFGKTIGYRGYDGCVPKPGDSNVPAASSAATGDRR